ARRGKSTCRGMGRESAGAQRRHRGEPETCRRCACGAQQAESAMIRVVFFLIVVGVLALGAAWLADRPGDVVVTWQGFRAETSLMVMAAALLVALAVLAGVWSIARGGARAYAAIAHVLIAVGSGDIDAAQKLSADANRLAPGEPLTLLLSAQAAQLAGDRDGAERAFRAMAGRADTKALGL